MMPSQKLGIVMPKKPNIEPRLSTQELGFAPAQTPSGMPITIAISSEAIASSIVAGNRSPIRPITGSAYLNDLPRSPEAMLARKRRYWT